MRRSASAGLIAALIGSRVVFAATGTVFDDRNGDGLRESGEPGLASVEVSNGVDVVLTDQSGAYSVPDRPGARIFVVKPRGWRPPVDASELPRFHAQPGAQGPVDFPLTRSDEPDEMSALIFTDTQPSTPTEVGYLSRGVVDHVRDASRFAFGVTLGDVVYDRPDLFASVNAALSRIGIPWYSLPGNHDVALGNPDEAAAVASFERVYGPSTYAFHAGPALFIALDDVRPLGGPRFTGGLREDQFAFIANLLRRESPEEWVVLMMHIPMFAPSPMGPETFRGADRLRLFGLLKDRSHLLVLSGHTHYQRHVIYGRDDGWEGTEPLHDYNVAAACGGFWGGPAGPDGIPVSTMWDGTPPGYATLTFKGGTVLLDYLPARLPAGYQLKIHAPRAVAPRQGYVSFYANVFNGDDRWKVEARVDGRAWNRMTRVLGWDPSYAAAYLEQDSRAQPLPGPRLPDPVVCYHLWRGMLPADLALGSHVLQVRATDATGVEYQSQEAVDIASP